MEILERSETLVIFDVYNNEQLWEEYGTLGTVK